MMHVGTDYPAIRRALHLLAENGGPTPVDPSFDLERIGPPCLAGAERCFRHITAQEVDDFLFLGRQPETFVPMGDYDSAVHVVEEFCLAKGIGHYGPPVR
jgi:hypothetical protein